MSLKSRISRTLSFVSCAHSALQFCSPARGHVRKPRWLEAYYQRKARNHEIDMRAWRTAQALRDWEAEQTANELSDLQETQNLELWILGAEREIAEAVESRCASFPHISLEAVRAYVISLEAVSGMREPVPSDCGLYDAIRAKLENDKLEADALDLTLADLRAQAALSGEPGILERGPADELILCWGSLDMAQDALRLGRDASGWLMERPNLPASCPEPKAKKLTAAERWALAFPDSEPGAWRQKPEDLCKLVSSEVADSLFGK